MKKILVVLFCAAAACAHAQNKTAVKAQIHTSAAAKKAVKPVADIDPVLRNGQADIMRRAGAWRGYSFRPGSGAGGC